MFIILGLNPEKGPTYFLSGNSSTLFCIERSRGFSVRKLVYTFLCSKDEKDEAESVWKLVYTFLSTITSTLFCPETRLHFLFNDSTLFNPSFTK